MSDIINAAESLSLDKTSSIAQVKSQGGRRSAQKRGPTLYNLEVKVPVQRMNDTNHLAIEDEIMALEYGAKTFNQASVSGTMKADTLTKPRGTWVGTPVINGVSTGNTISISGLASSVNAGSFVVGKKYQILIAGDTNFTLVGSADSNVGTVFTATGVGAGTGTADEIQVATGDFVQFQGSTKVYQLMAGSTNTSLKLNCPIAESPNNSSAVVFGNSVDFNFCLKDIPSTTFLPGNVVEFGSFYFEEVIE